MEYQLNGEAHVLTWLGKNHSPDEQEAMLAWLPRLAAAPESEYDARLPRLGVPAYTARVPGTDAYVDYVVVEQYKTVLILGVEDVRLGPP